MGQVVYKPHVEDYFFDLIEILYEENYFSFKENAYEYVENIRFNIETNIHLSHHKPTPKDLSHLGDYYIFYNPNKQTTWYILFDKREDKFLITSIFNNHCFEANFL
jgi:hypothetical protein